MAPHLSVLLLKLIWSTHIFIWLFITSACINVASFRRFSSLKHNNCSVSSVPSYRVPTILFASHVSSLNQIRLLHIYKLYWHTPRLVECITFYSFITQNIFLYVAHTYCGYLFGAYTRLHIFWWMNSKRRLNEWKVLWNTASRAFSTYIW